MLLRGCGLLTSRILRRVDRAMYLGLRVLNFRVGLARWILVMRKLRDILWIGR